MHRRELLLAMGSAAALLAGCNPKVAEPPKEEVVDESKLREFKVLLVDDPDLVEVLQRDWRSTSQRPFSAKSVTAAELLAMEKIPADVVIYPPSLLGELAESGRIAALDEKTLENPELAREEIIDLARVRLGHWGKRTYAIPLSAPSLLTVWRRDAIPAAPQTWKEYDELCSQQPSETPAACDPLAKESRSLVLLARACSRARGRNQHSTLFDVADMKALIDRPPFVRALEELAARAQGRVEETLTTTPAAVWEQLRSGKASVGLTWPHRTAGDAAGEEEENKNADLVFARLPGTTEYYTLASSSWTEEEEMVRRYPVLGGAGRLISAIRGPLGLREAANLLVLLAGKTRSETLGPLWKEAFPVRQSQLGAARKWLGESGSEEMARQFAETVVETFTAQDYLFLVNVPEAVVYLDALDSAIERAIRGEKPAAESLAEAAAAWNEITEKRGRDKQLLAYLRSLDLESIG